MALLFQDSFDLYGAVGELTRRWAAKAGVVTLSTTAGRFGGGRIQLNDELDSVTTPSLGTPQTVIISYAFKVNDHVSNSTSDILSLFNEVGETSHFDSLTGTNTIRYRRGTTTLGTFQITRDEWNWISIKITTSNTVGTCDVVLNGTNVLSLSGLDNNGGAGTDATTEIRFWGHENDTWEIDDVIICDDTGAAPFNDLLSDSRMSISLPDAPGDSAGFTPVPAVSNELNVDDVAPDDDTSYNEAEVAATKDLYNVAAMAYSPSTIDSVSVVALIRNPDSGTTQTKLKVKSGATEGTGAAQLPTSGYTYLEELFLLNPDTAAAWTEGEVNAMQVGMEIA
jgi:hypothetical protein